MLKRLILLLFCITSLFAEQKTSWHQYDPDTQTETWHLTEEKHLSWVYDIFHNRIQSEDWIGKTTYTYDLDHRLTSTCSPNQEKTGYRYDPYGNLLAITYPSRLVVSYNYFPGNVLSKLRFHNTEISYSYDKERKLVLEKKFSNGVTTSYSMTRLAECQT